MRKTMEFPDGKRHVCDTDKSTELGSKSFGNYGDPAGYSETLYRTNTKVGYYFVVGVGGDQSPYAAGEAIRPLSDDEAAAWQQ